MLAEGPVWDPVRRHVLWVDIPAGLVVTGELMEDGTISVRGRERVDSFVGAVAPSASGEWLVAGKQQLFLRRSDGTIDPGPRLIPAGTNRRLNDGKPDPSGRFVVGTLSIDGGSESEELFVVDDDRVTRLDSDLKLSNGLAWTADGATLYSIDTGRRVVYRRPWPITTSTRSKRELFLSINDGSPDGCCLDADEHLWVAIWGRGEVRRYDPSGRLVDTVYVPAPNTSSVAFCGPDLSTLVITTASEQMTDKQLARYPLSGHLFTARPGIAGLPPNLWTGSR